MPTYKVTDPNTGKTVRLTGESPPSEGELSNIFGRLGGTEETKKPAQITNPITAALKSATELFPGAQPGGRFNPLFPTQYYTSRIPKAVGGRGLSHPEAMQHAGKIVEPIEQAQVKGVPAQIAYGGVQAAPMMMGAVNPFLKGAKAVLGAKALPIATTMGGFGAYETAKGVVGGDVKSPTDLIKTFGGGALGGGIWHGAGRMGATVGTPILKKVAGKYAPNIATALATGTVSAIGAPPGERVSSAMLGGAFGLKYPGKPIKVSQTAKTKLARQLNQSVLKFRKGSTSLKHGDPAITLAKEGIYARDVDGLKVKVNDRIKQYSEDVNSILKTASTGTPKTPVVLKSYQSALTPLYTYRKQLAKAPNVNRAELAKVDELILNLSGYKLTPAKRRIPINNKGITLRNSTLLDAYTVKQTVHDQIGRAYESPSGGSKRARVLKSVDYKLKTLIAKEVGKANVLNESQRRDFSGKLQRESDLISITGQLEQISNAEKADGFMKNLSRIKFFVGSAGAIGGAAGGGPMGGVMGGVGSTVTMGMMEQALLKPGVKTRTAAWLMRAPKAELETAFKLNPVIMNRLKKYFYNIRKISKKLSGIGLATEDVSNIVNNPLYKLPMSTLLKMKRSAVASQSFAEAQNLDEMIRLKKEGVKVPGNR